MTNAIIDQGIPTNFNIRQPWLCPDFQQNPLQFYTRIVCQLIYFIRINSSIVSPTPKGGLFLKVRFAFT